MEDYRLHDSDPPEATVEQAIRLLRSLGYSVINEESISNHMDYSTNNGVLGKMGRLLIEDHEFRSAAAKRAFYISNLTGVFVAVFAVAVIAGLFMGLMTLDALDLQIIVRASHDQEERGYAATLLPIVKDRHRLLATLLIVNALAYETVPIFLDALVPSWVAILLSTTLILVFGEILPSAIFTGPHQLRLGAAMAPLVNLLMVIFYPLAAPCAVLLDYFVHDESHVVGQEAYNRGELTALVKIQYEERFANKRRRNLRKKDSDEQTWSALKKEIIIEADNDDAGVEQLNPPLHKQEVDLITGALMMKTRMVMDVYTSLRHVYALSDDFVLDIDRVSKIYAMGYSRVPIYHRTGLHDDDDRVNMVGILMTRQLMMVDWDHNREVSTMPLVRPLCVSPRMNLVDLLNRLKSCGSLMAFVCARPDVAQRALDAEIPIPVFAGFMGVVCLEDIMESILQDRIFDEEDARDRDRAVATLQKWAALKLQGFIRKKAKKLKEARERRLISNGGIDSSDNNSTDRTPLLAQNTTSTNGGSIRASDVSADDIC